MSANLKQFYTFSLNAHKNKQKLLKIAHTPAESQGTSKMIDIFVFASTHWLDPQTGCAQNMAKN